MTSVKDRIAALHQNENSDASTSDHVAPTTSSRKKPLIHNFQSMHDRISAAAASTQRTIMTSQNHRNSNRHGSEPQSIIQSDDKTNPSRNRVAALADNMKGLNMQAMLGGYSRNEKQQQHGSRSVAGYDGMVEREGFQRAVIARGVRRGRTIPDSLLGTKLSTE